MIRATCCLLATILCWIGLAANAQDTSQPSDEVQALIEILEDPAARDALIARLQGAEEAAEDAAALPTSAGRQVAEATKATAEATAEAVSNAWAALARVPNYFRSLDAEDIAGLAEALWALALVIVVTSLVFFGLRAWARRLFSRMGRAMAGAGVVQSMVALLATAAIDAMILLVAWGVGYLAALFFHGEAGVIGVRQSLYLNAFLVVGLVRVGLRALFSPSAPELRFVEVSDQAAARLARWFGAIVSILGYGQLLIVPIVNAQANFFVGRGVSTLLAFLAILVAAVMVFRWRREAADWMLGPAENPAGKAWDFLVRCWHWPVLAYLFAMAIVVAARPDGLIWPVLIDSAQVVAVIVAGVFSWGVVRRVNANGVTLPASLSARFPALQGRLGAFLARFSWVIRAFVFGFIALFVLDAVDLIDLQAWAASEWGRSTISVALSVLAIVIVGFLVWLVFVSWIDFRLNPGFGRMPTARETTLLTLLKNAVTIVFVIVLMMFALSELGVNIAPLIASAGVLGLAIGFGAQKMVQDIITGIFIQFENVMNVGDVVTLGGTTGVVEKLTIRSVSLRDVEGIFHVIPFSSVDMVSNYVKGYGNFVSDISIAYRENVADGKEAMLAAFEALKVGEAGQHVYGDLQWFGVQSLGDSSVVLRARIKCAPGEQWGVGRAYNELVKAEFDARGIEMPFPHQTIYFGQDKRGDAPPVNVVQKAEV